MDNRTYSWDSNWGCLPPQVCASDNAASMATTRYSPRSSNSEKTEPSIVVIGAGLTGMACALMLAKRNLPVVVLERDTCDGFGQSSEHPARRSGAPHVNRPHLLLAGGRDVLLRSLPEVARELYT